MNTEEEVHLTDLIPVETLQKIQNSFSKMARMAALITDENGDPLTEGSNFSDFCMNYCRKSPLGRKRCEKCDRDGALRVLETGKPVSYFCHAGLVDFAAPILLGGRMIGTLVGGQVLSEEPDYDNMRETAKELGLDEEGFIEAARKTQIVPKAAIDRATNFIFEFSLVVSEMAYKTYETIRLSKLAVSQKSDFLANMSHEIRTPMNAVLGMAEMALREEMTPQAKQYIRQIRSSGKHLLVIINDILDFSKIESGKLDIVKVEYEPLSLVNDLINVVNTRIGTKDLEFTIDLDPNLPQKLYGDSVRIHQILLNLLNNAVKFTERGEVHLSLCSERIDGETVMLKAVIRDTGIGIKKEDMGKLFQSFQQVDSKRNRNIEGTGLGLAISKQLLKLMNGTISLESEYNKGSTFYVQIPQRIINGAPSIPVPENDIKAALLIENKYVHAQLCRDLSALNIDYFDFDEKSGVSEGFNYIIAEKGRFNKTVKALMTDDQSLKCLMLVPYNETASVDMPRLKILSKPACLMSLYSALCSGQEVVSSASPEKDSFVFTAPTARVLIVDDNPINLSVASGIIEPLEMQVDTANGATETIEKVRKVKYDIIFMDHMMPEVDGVETTHIIRRLISGYEDVPIIALTANAMGGTREMFLREGMNDFIAKPIEVSEMVAMIRKWLPQEKIIPVTDGQRKSGAGNHGGSSGVSIEGLNTVHAISMLGSEKLYMQVLKDYYQAIDKRAQIITQALEKGDIKNYTIEVHSLKSTSRQIGADHLSDLAARLEKAGNDNDTDFIRANTGELIEQYKAVKETIAPVFPELSKKPEEETEDFAAVSALLAGAEDAVSGGDSEKLNALLKELSGCRLTAAQSQCLEKFSALLKAQDFSTLGVILGIWRQINAAESGNACSPAADIAAALDKMQDALEDYDSLVIDDALELMGTLKLPQEQEELLFSLKQAAEDSDIDLCGSIVEKWRTLLS